MILSSMHISSPQSKQLWHLATRGSAEPAAVSELDTPLEPLLEPSPKDGGHNSCPNNDDEFKSILSVPAALHGKDSHRDGDVAFDALQQSQPPSLQVRLCLWKADLFLVLFSYHSNDNDSSSSKLSRRKRSFGARMSRESA